MVTGETPEEQDTTKYLLSSKANKKRLMKSMKQLKKIRKQHKTPTLYESIQYFGIDGMFIPKSMLDE